MNLLVAVFLPPLAILGCLKPVSAVLALLLCMTLVGWPVASWWAVSVVKEHAQDKRFKRLGWQVHR